MDKKKFAIQLEKYLLELKETMPVCDQAHAWGYGAISFAWRIDAISIEDCERLIRDWLIGQHVVTKGAASILTI